MSLLLAMLMLLGTWLVAGLATLCVGAAVWRLLGLERGSGAAVEPVIPSSASTTSENAFELPERFRTAHPSPQTFVGPLDTTHRAALSFGLGLVGMVAVLSAWHLILPVNLLAVAAVLIVASLAGAWALPELRSSASAVGRAGLPVLIVWLLVGVWLSNRAAAGAELSVTGLAWYPLVGWIDAYPTVPGVGNVHPVYGWNAGGLLMSALLSEGPWIGRVGHASNGWLLWWLSLPALLAWKKLWEPAYEKPKGYIDTQGVTRKTTIGTVYDAAWLAPVLVLGMSAAVTDPLPDVGAGVFLWLAGGAALRSSGPDEPHRGRRIDTLIAALLCCAGAAVWDPMMLPSAGVLGTFVLWRLLKSERAWVEGRRPTRSIGFDHEKLPGLQARSGAVTAALAMSACVLALWFARNVVMTGTAAFPLTTAAALPVEWALSARDASLEGWLPRAEPTDAARAGLVVFVLPTVLGGVLLMAWLGRGGAEGRWKHCGGAGIALALAAVAWFATGRGIGAFGPAWAALATGVALNARAVVQRGRPIKGPTGPTLAGIIGGAAVLLAAAHVFTGGGAALWPMGKQAQASLALDRPPDIEVAFNPVRLVPIRLPQLEAAGLAERRTPDLLPWFSRWGVEVALTAAPFVPPTLNPQTLNPPTDEVTAGPLPWSAPQPSLSEAPSDHLRYRSGPDNLRAGFVIDRADPGSLTNPSRTVRSADRDREPTGGS